MLRSSSALLAATLAGSVTFGCVTPPSKGDKKPDLSNTILWTLKSEDFTSGGVIPAEFTCEGAGKSPELDWNAGPDGTQSYALVLKDISIIERMPDPATRSGAYYWALWNVPATTLQIPRGLSPAATPPGLEGASQWSAAEGQGYLPPCPNATTGTASATPATDHFAFTLYALPTSTLEPDLDGGSNLAEALDQQLKKAALADVNLLFTSNATPDAGGGAGNGAGGSASE